ncbi:aminotransferase class I/II-fold pyridoxal phosphate-dependent enzyme [Paenibacillus sp. J2TS4]|uniref:aminotransferase class I/II-fold pyridoxal phosphate-dependent enzyme n=1 Tax=Paenibacillus sp. J2TS4 TaxID=2807194 RepID=UPI001B1B905B|nr:aminotransferase class I/II-fold pyridoxal phosphate-dependent enzyme [Paenibacillus sp. J2TS4]GIP36308.1 lysine decarboxylase [Paenibacillus sp. J2TS4]
MSVKKEIVHAPLYETLLGCHFQRNSSFHVPGHKGGRALPAQFKGMLEQVMSIDYTEITGLDDLHQPEGVIKEAQDLAADCFGADRTFFLVNGSTVGNLAMITAVCGRGDILIVQRNVHKSVIHGLMIAGAKAVFVAPQSDPETGLAAGISNKDLVEALDRYPQAKAVFLTNPNYYGMAMDLEQTVRLVHSRGIPLLVDEAHGAHFGFHPELPRSALSVGADAVVQSSHKMLTALTMGAMLHVRSTRIDPNQISGRLSMLQSSSPSYPIMASLDLSRSMLQSKGSELFTPGLQCVKELRQHILSLDVFGVVSGHKNEVYAALDPFKITLWDRIGTLSGFDLQQQLEQRGCMTEMADPRHVLLLFSLASEPRDVNHLLSALLDINDKLGLKEKENPLALANNRVAPPMPPISQPIPFDLDHSLLLDHVRTLPLEETAGFRSAEMVIPYPPGIPVLYPGEPILKETTDYLQVLAATGARFQGISDRKLSTLKVVKDH